MLTTREAILLKVENSYGVDPTPSSSTDAILVSNLSIANEGLRMLDRPNIKPTISTDQKVFAGTLKKLSFTAEIKGSGTAGTAPEIGQALRCCGLSEQITASTSVEYMPASDNQETCTIYYYQDGKLTKITGAVGTVTFNAEGAAFGTAQFEFTGHESSPVDASFPVISYDDTVPVPFMDLAFTVDGYGAIINSFSMALSNEISMPGDVRQEFGFGEIRISKRDPNGTIDPESTLVATNDFYSAFKNGTRLALTTGNVGKVAGNMWKFDASIAIRDISQGERDQIRTDELTFGCHETVADDEFTLTFL